jgi:hypothetical protein
LYNIDALISNKITKKANKIVIEKEEISSNREATDDENFALNISI